MAYIRCDFSSICLKMNTTLIALLPEQIPLDQVPVIYLLHGLKDNCTGWSRYTAVERYSRERGVAVIMPEVQRSYYTDMAEGVKYYSYICDELPAVCQRLFGLSAQREKNYIMGVSMGGYGALKCALNVPERYAGCASFSAVVDLGSRVYRVEPAEQLEFKAILGAAMEVPEEGDLSALVRKSAAVGLPRFFMTCGEQDDFFEDNCSMVSSMKERGINVMFEHWNDGHTWTFWDRSIERAIDVLLP